MIAKHKRNKRSNFSRKKQNQWKQRLVKLSQKSNRLKIAFLMQMWIEFSCQAEVVLFQMAVR